MTNEQICMFCKGPLELGPDVCPPDISSSNPCPLLQLTFEAMSPEEAARALRRIWNTFGPPSWEKRGEVIPFRRRGERDE